MSPTKAGGGRPEQECQRKNTPHLTPSGEPPPRRSPRLHSNSHAANQPSLARCDKSPATMPRATPPTQGATTFCTHRKGTIAADAVAEGTTAK